jgi:hypothetical protein
MVRACRHTMSHVSWKFPSHLLAYAQSSHHVQMRHDALSFPVNPIASARSCTLSSHMANQPLCCGPISWDRFVDVNLNRIYTADDVAEASDPQCKSYEHTLVGRLLLAIRDCDEFLDVHSTSAPTPPFAFHMGSAAAAAYASSFPVAYTLEDRTEGARGTAVAYAAQVGVERAVVVECGQHDAPQSVEVAKAVIRCFVTGGSGSEDCPVDVKPAALRIEDGAYVRKGFR